MVVMVGSKTAITMVEVMKKAVMLVGLFSFHPLDRKSTRLNSSHGYISYAVFCLKKKKKNTQQQFMDTSTRQLHPTYTTRIFRNTHRHHQLNRSKQRVHYRRSYSSINTRPTSAQC